MIVYITKSLKVIKIPFHYYVGLEIIRFEVKTNPFKTRKYSVNYT